MSYEEKSLRHKETLEKDRCGQFKEEIHKRRNWSPLIIIKLIIVKITLLFYMWTSNLLWIKKNLESQDCKANKEINNIALIDQVIKSYVTSWIRISSNALDIYMFCTIEKIVVVSAIHVLTITKTMASTICKTLKNLHSHCNSYTNYITQVQLLLSFGLPNINSTVRSSILTLI